MTNILDRSLDFNPNIRFCDDGTQLSNDAGMLAIPDFLDAIGFKRKHLITDRL